VLEDKNDFSRLEDTVNKIKQEIVDIKNIIILKELFPDFVKKSLPDYESLQLNKFFYDAFDRSYFQSNEGKGLRELFACKLIDIIKSLKSVAGGVTHHQYCSILGQLSHKNITLKDSEQSFLYSLMEAHCDNSPLYDEIRKEVYTNNFRNYSEYFWRLFCSIYIHKKDYETAEKIIIYYINRFGIDSVKNHLLLSSFAYDLGYKEDVFKYANTIYCALKQSEDDNLLINLIKNKSVAVVGNGPQQNGEKTGKEIDAHDIVIRFNDYANSENSIDDFGKKTDIWCNWIRFPLSLRDLKSIKCILIATDIYTWPTLSSENPNLWKDLYEYILSGGKVLTYSYKIRKDILDNITIPTSGFSVVYWIKKLKSNFKKTDCYGFSFIEKKFNKCTKNTWLHFDGKVYSTNTLDHSLGKEKELLDQLWGNNITRKIGRYVSSKFKKGSKK